MDERHNHNRSPWFVSGWWIIPATIAGAYLWYLGLSWLWGVLA